MNKGRPQDGNTKAMGTQQDRNILDIIQKDALTLCTMIRKFPSFLQGYNGKIEMPKQYQKYVFGAPTILKVRIWHTGSIRMKIFAIR